MNKPKLIVPIETITSPDGITRPMVYVLTYEFHTLKGWDLHTEVFISNAVMQSKVASCRAFPDLYRDIRASARHVWEF